MNEINPIDPVTEVPVADAPKFGPYAKMVFYVGSAAIVYLQGFMGTLGDHTLATLTLEQWISTALGFLGAVTLAIKSYTSTGWHNRANK